MAEPTPENATAEESKAAAAPDAVPTDGAASEAAAVETPAVAAATAIGEGMLAAMTSAGPQMGFPGGNSPPTENVFSHLPLHTRSQLKIQVSLQVTLARQRRPIHEITELGQGTLIKFEKTYDQPLELSVGDVPIAEGEAVKVGDKFGLRIGKIIRPHERFASVRS